MNEPYQDPDPVSSIKTQTHIRKASAGESKKLFRKSQTRIQIDRRGCPRQRRSHHLL